MQKLRSLENWFREYNKLAVAFSGGIDSSVLAYVGKEILGENFLAITVDAHSLKKNDKMMVNEFCEKYDIPHEFVKVNEFEIKEFVENPKDRCFFCKRVLFGKLVDVVSKKGFDAILDGTNISDLLHHRPGYKAISDNEFIKKPFIELKISKKDIREIAKHLGLINAKKPSSACLATRIPTGVKISKEVLHQIDRAEDKLSDLGFTQVRIRHHGDLARIQCLEEEFFLLNDNREKIKDSLLKLGYRYVTFDLNFYEET